MVWPVTTSEAVDYLRSLQPAGVVLGLDSTQRLAAAVGDPQTRLRFIHVAGTNGKGSVCALLESVYRNAGLKVGLYTSPHLVRFGERIQVDRIPISDSDLARHVATLKAVVDRLGGPAPTFFEFTTVLALCHFAESCVDLVVWETGLGGRLDATNIVTPLASVITNVSLDHMQVLGSTVAAIAAEKAGIIKPGVPVLTAAMDPDAEAILRFKARELDSPYLHLGPSEVAAFRLDVGLLGPHQRVNGALAAATVRLLRVFLPVTDEALRDGLARAQWAGRMQVLQRGARRIILDGAHNRAGVEALREGLPEVCGSTRPTLIVGLLAEKEVGPMLGQLVPLAGRILTVPVANPRTLGSEEIRAAVVAMGLGRPARAASSLADALRWAAADPVVLVTGSLYLIGEALELLGESSIGDAEERSLNAWGGAASGSEPRPPAISGSAPA
ncbi:MAG: bifunctional folylpolyglutamate synthase/dihydrofolate synthase [Verrucomicrobia bacterium]|nr:bifunctional folylpolyglutamate synthase/dihydrofolate synthase [Verrucomicrobiota bacterium]